jgi:hypothetical protein
VLTPVIPATQEAEVRRIEVQSQPGQIVQEPPSQKKKPFTKRAGGVAPGVEPRPGKYESLNSSPSTAQNKQKHL